MTKIPLHIAEKLLLLEQGEIISASSAKHAVIEGFVDENIIQRTGRIQKKFSVADKNTLKIFLQNKYGINDLGKYIETLKQIGFTRTDLTKISSNSKLKKVRTFKGFLVNSYMPIQAVLNDEPFLINPPTGSFQFIYDFKHFSIPQDLTVVGIENPENFRHIEGQKYLFKDIKPLFVCRYPQNRSKDLLKWLQSIPDPYLPFGDFDFAGIGIYLNEYKKYIGEKAVFFIPENIENLLEKYGNKELYDNQKTLFDKEKKDDSSLNYLISIIHKYKKGLEQEIFIKFT